MSIMKVQSTTICVIVVSLSMTTMLSAQTETTNVETDKSAEVVPSESRHNFWMDQKLRLSKDVLTGLATADFAKIGRSAEIMRGLNRLERFVRRSPEGYKDQLAQFNFANKALLRAADAENLEGATLAFNQLTISCVRCHRVLRQSAINANGLGSTDESQPTAK